MIDYKALCAPLPAEAISQHPTKTYLSSIKGIYVTERFNEVFGVGKWTVRLEKAGEYPADEKSKMGPMVVVKVVLTAVKVSA